MKKILLMLSAAVVAFTSCTKIGDDIVPATESSVSFTVGGIVTRVTGTQFDGGDVIAVEAYKTDGSLFASSEYFYLNSIFTSLSMIDKGSESKLSYAAVYPSTTTTTSFDTDFSFVIEADQSAGDNYEMSDMLVAKVAETSLVEPSLTFYHTMTSIVLNIEGASVADCEVEIYAKNTVDSNISNATYEAVGDAVVITPAVNGESGFKAIIAPQDLDGKIASLIVNGVEYTWDIAATTFLSGYRYSYTWTVDAESGDSEVTFDGLIEDWIDGDINYDNDGDGDNEGGSTFDTITFDGSELPTSYSDDTITVGGCDFALSNVANFSSMYETSGPIQFKGSVDSYIYNTMAIADLSQIAITLAPEGTSYNNFTVYVGTAENPTETAIDGTRDGDVCTYEIPEGSTYFSIYNLSTYTAYAFTIEVLSGDATSSEGGSGSTTEPDDTTPDTDTEASTTTVIYPSEFGATNEE